MKKILIACGIVLALILVAAGILPFVIDINDIVAGQIPKIETQIHRKITIGDVKLTVLTGLGAEINNIKISNHPDFRKDDFIRIGSMRATVQLLPLLKKEVLISSVSIEKPFALIEKNAKGTMNFSDMIPAEKPEKQATAETKPKDPLSALEKIHISKISIKNGNFIFFDASAAKKPKEIKLEELKLTLKAVSLSQKINIDLETDVYADSRAGRLALSGNIGPIGKQLTSESIPVDLMLTLDEINLPLLASYVNGMHITSGSIIAKTSLKGRLQDLLQCRMDINWDKLDMKIKDAADKNTPAQQVSLNGPWQIEADISGKADSPTIAASIKLDKSAIGYGNMFQKEAGIPLSVAASGQTEKDALRIDHLKVALDKMALTGSVNIRNFADPFVDGTAEIALTSLDALALIIPALKTYELSGTIELSDARFKEKMDELKNLKGITGILTVKDGSAVSAELGKKIEKIQAAVSVADNAVQIKNTSLRIDSSDVNIDATIRNPMKPDITFNLASSYLDMDALLPPPSEKKKKPDAVEKSTGESTPNTGTSGKQKAPDLRANGKVSIKKCKYDQLIFDNVLAELQYADAVVTLKSLIFDTFDGNISTSAKVNISDMESPQWSADLTTRNINANAALSQFTSMKDTFYGNFNSKLALQGKGSGWTKISKTMTGNGSVDIVNGKLAKVNVLDAVSESLLKFKGLGMLAQSISPQSQKHLNETKFDELSGKFNIVSEKILVDAMTMSSPDFKLTGTGNIGFDKSLDLDTILVLSKPASEHLQKDIGMKYLLNKDQQVEIPCAVKGDVAAPRITADGDSLNRLLQNAAGKAVQDQIQKGVGDQLGKEADKLLKSIFK